MSLIGQDPKEQIIARFARHVSSGKAEFFAGVGLDFIFGKREGVYAALKNEFSSRRHLPLSAGRSV